MPEKLLYDVADACRLTSLGRSKLYELLAAGEIASVQIGRRRLISHEALQSYIARLQGISA